MTWPPGRGTRRVSSRARWRVSVGSSCQPNTLITTSACCRRTVMPRRRRDAAPQCRSRAGEAAAATASISGEMSSESTRGRGLVGEEAGGVPGAAAQFEHPPRVLVGDQLGQPIVRTPGDEPVTGFEQRPARANLSRLRLQPCGHVRSRSPVMIAAGDV